MSIEAAGVARTRVIVDALAHREMRSLAIVYVCFKTAEMGGWIAVTTVAHEHGGIDEASAVVVAQLLPAALVALTVGAMARALGLRTVLAGGLFVQSLATGGVAVALWTDAPVLWVYGFAIVGAIAVVTTRPTIAAVMPSVVDGPNELTAANSAVGFLDSAAVMLGPVVTAVGFALAGAAAPFVVFGALTLTAGVVAVRLKSTARVDAVPAGDVERDEPALCDPAADRAVRRRARPILLVLASHALLIGALDLLFVVVAIDVTNGPPARAGWLNTAFGAGAVIGGAATALLIGRRRLWPAVLIAGLVASVAVGLVGAGGSPGVSAAMFAACGVGAAVLFVSARTLLQRFCDLASLCRAFSMAEASEMAMLLVGALTIPLLVDGLGSSRAGAGVGVVVAIAIAVALPRIVLAEREVQAPLDRLELLRAVGLFAALPAPTLETLAREAEAVDVLPGTPVIVQGDGGDRFYVVGSGEVVVDRDGIEVARLARGAGFGELALLYDAPRNATVTTTCRTALLAIDRVPFLVAMTGRPADQLSTVRAR
jgi:MFS family permease